jgi:predicted protein tyrosine phosphatase
VLLRATGVLSFFILLERKQPGSVSNSHGKGNRERHLMRALFICSRNRLRSPTAEQVFSSWPDTETDSAGLAPDAVARLQPDQIEWAEVLFVMERRHKAKLIKTFGRYLKGKRIVCLDIPDKYGFMDPELIALLERKAGRFLDR